MGFMSTIFLFTIFAFIFRWLVRSTFGRCRSERRLDWCTAIVTGANTGIGKETAKGLAKRGARVILACRNKERADLARRQIVESTGNQNVHVRILDLASLESVRNFAHEINKTEKRLDILINNAGVFWLPLKKTSDGLNITLQINHYGPFLLTNLLSDLLHSSAPSRIIFVSSGLYIYAPAELRGFHHEFKGFGCYCLSKLYNILISNCFAKKLKHRGVTCNCVDPGNAYTDLFRRSLIAKGLMWGPLRILNKSPSDAAEAVLHAAISEDTAGVTGKYFSNCEETDTLEKASNMDFAQELWHHSEKAVGLRNDSHWGHCAVH